jgi:hypothetical protein
MRWFGEKKKMDTLHTLNGKPIENPTVAPPVPMIFPVGDPTVTATANAVKTQVHRAECGDVGIVGEVGDLGTNAK